jgi:hypothetical protein
MTHAWVTGSEISEIVTSPAAHFLSGEALINCAGRRQLLYLATFQQRRPCAQCCEALVLRRHLSQLRH